MIRYFDKNETNFNHNMIILNPISCYITEEANGLFELEAEFAKNISITEGDIIKAPSPRGEQLFRIYRIKKSLKGKTAYAKHIFYDLCKNFLINVELSNVSGFTAIQSVLGNCEIDHNFSATSDILSQNSSKYVRINPVQAIIGDENSIINTWGGNLIRNNFNITLKADGIDRGYEIRMRKNLIGIDADIDMTSVKTRIYPTVSLGDNAIYALPEKYVDSPLINNYVEPVIYSLEVPLTDEQKELYTDEQISMNDIYQIMRDHCNDLFEIDNIDKPTINYKVDFVELSKTEQYKDLTILEQLDLYDIVTVNVSHLDINMKARVIKYNYDCIKERYNVIELGDFSAVSNYQTDNIVRQLNSGIKASLSAAEYATNVITGNRGGYVILRNYPDGKPYELLVMDTEDINTAHNVFRLNKSGLGFSRTGYNGTYGTAMTIDGHIVADYIDTGILRGILLQSSNYTTNAIGTQINLADGTIDTKNFKVDSSGNIIANNATMNNGSFAGQIIGGSMNINNRFIVNSNGDVTLPSNTTISWSQINNADSYVTTITQNTVTTAYVNALNVTANSVKSNWVYTNVINANQIYGGMIQGVMFRSNSDDLDPNEAYMLLSSGTLDFFADGGVKFLEVSHSGIVGVDPRQYGGEGRTLNISPVSSTIEVGNIYADYITVGGYKVLTTNSKITASYASNSGSTSSVSAGGSLGLFSISSGGGYISYQGATKDNTSGYVYIGSQTLQAGTIQQISLRESKDNICSYDKNALSLICNTPIRSYTLKDNIEDTKTHVGVIIDEAPEDIIGSGGKTVSLYDMISVSWKAIQEQQNIINDQADRIKDLEQRLSKLEVA